LGNGGDDTDLTRSVAVAVEDRDLAVVIGLDRLEVTIPNRLLNEPPHQHLVASRDTHTPISQIPMRA
jgi:hypothetical protein